MYYLYILECSDKTLYTGITTDLERRLKKHLSGVGGNYTRAHKAKRFVYTEECGGKSEALKREILIKRLPRTEKLKIIKK